MKRILLILILAVGLPSLAAEIEIGQKNKRFSSTTIKAKVGDTLVFTNDDPYFHNVFSLSDAQAFDLGSFPTGEKRRVVLKKEGTIVIECAIHPDMKLTVQVEK
jgi:plastocyanin